jgi:hypothetical protein
VPDIALMDCSGAITIVNVKPPDRIGDPKVAATFGFTEVESEGFAILENLTAQTQPVLDIVQARRRPEPSSAPVKQPGRPAAKTGPARGRGSSKTTGKKASTKT